MRIPEHDQTRLYESYWSPIEGLFRGSESTFDNFVRDYIALETQSNKQERANNLYSAFRRVFGTFGTDTQKLEELLGRLLRFARYHAAYSVNVGAPGNLSELLARLRRLTDAAGPLIMRLFDCHSDRKTLSSEDFGRALVLLESYVFRRAILGEQARNYWQVFTSLAHKIDLDQPLEGVMVGLARQLDSYRFPDDEEFLRGLEEGNVYGKRVCWDLLDRLENSDTKERTDTTGYSIEHVMPQNENLVREWRGMLGSSWRDIQREWLHRLGNLTLTAYNSTYSDRPFKQKQTISGGFQDSSVHLNRFIRDRQQWTATEMEQRGKELAAQSIKIWPPLIVQQTLIAAAERADIQERAKRSDVEKVPVTAGVRELFQVLRQSIRAISPEVVEVAESRSVSYHAPTFFLEVIPRKRYVHLLLPLDFNEIIDPLSLAEDATRWKFVVNAVHDGGVILSVEDTEGIAKAMPLVRQAYARRMA